MDVNVNDMMACGGGGTSAIWRQMLADLYGCGVKTLENREGPALGVALLAGVGVGAYKSVEEACDATVKIKGVQEPLPVSCAAKRIQEAGGTLINRLGLEKRIRWEGLWLFPSVLS